MAKEQIKHGSIKRFGPRYGRKVKEKFAEVEALRRKKYKCPYCSQQKIKRISAGIWECSKCKSKFTSRAYAVSKKIILKEEIKKGGEKVEDEKDVVKEDYEDEDQETYEDIDEEDKESKKKEDIEGEEEEENKENIE